LGAAEQNRLGGGHPFALLNDDELVGADIRQSIYFAARPYDFEARNLLGFAEPECEWQLALRTVARPGLDQAPELRLVAHLQRDFGADAVAIGSRPDRLDAQQVILIAAVIAHQAGGPVVGGQEKVEIAIPVEIRIGRAAAD